MFIFNIFQSNFLYKLWTIFFLPFSFYAIFSFSIKKRHLLANPIVIDNQTPKENQASLEEAPNGVHVINIAQPNSEGLSHKKFKKFSVPSRGVIFNNSQEIGNSKLGGTLLYNPNLESSPASIILTEVTTPHYSHLNGYTEIFGQKAEFILANPYGITCHGCGFIHTPRVTLTTGKPRFQGPRLQSFAVEEGEVRFLGKENNLRNITDFLILSRRGTLEGEVHARNLKIYLGKNNFDFIQRRISSQRAVGSTETLTNFSFDAKALGSIYADRIYLESTEEGLGVSIAGKMSAYKMT